MRPLKKNSVPVIIGGIVVRELFPTSGGRSSTFASGCYSCNRTGEAPDGSVGHTEHDYVVGGLCSIFPQGRSKDGGPLWYRRLSGASM